ncbi:putative ribonuclease FAU-1 [Candidatus Lokiarchaeum ossiferum]|uniref:Ribonuclease FAU-1 n=1 Tax=Candidatus Lokiarchaeum ossiferum TaxID=2951803 RepID=A0ABY6HXX9_9ARCH|nr:putative ribonuclease FAU-1 [Candidatus Lokiarchaeum sp. B-35]
MDANKPAVYIRGIYSTALTKIFIDAGYPIIFASKEIRKRFNLPFRPKKGYSKDITIRDRLDKQGVSIMFKKHVWEKLEAEEFKDFPLWQTNNANLIVYKARFHKNAIYRGLIVKSNRNFNYSYVRLAPESINKNGELDSDDFKTTVARYARYIPDSKEGIFQITHEDSGENYASLGSFYTIPGDLIVIVPYNNKVIISKEITYGKQKKRLFDLGKEIQQTKKYGFIFRTAAELATNDEILEEVDRLEKDLIQTQTDITQFPDRIGEIYSNYRSINVIFPAQMKNELDNIRRTILPTLESHHIIKSLPVWKKTASEPKKDDNKFQDRRKYDKKQSFREEDEGQSLNFGKLVDFTENLLKGVDSSQHDTIHQNFLHEYYKEILKTRKSFSVSHQKLSGKTIHLSSGYIKAVELESNLQNKVVLKRRMREGGLYDGLNTPIEYGDYAIGEYTQGSWYYVSSYYSANNELKGRYYNVNTPIEITEAGIHYIDLEVDVVENMVGERKIIDKDILDHALDMGFISEEMYAKAITLAENIVEGRVV